MRLKSCLPVLVGGLLSVIAAASCSPGPPDELSASTVALLTVGQQSELVDPDGESFNPKHCELTEREPRGAQSERFTRYDTTSKTKTYFKDLVHAMSVCGWAPWVDVRRLGCIDFDGHLRLEPDRHAWLTYADWDHEESRKKRLIDDTHAAMFAVCMDKAMRDALSSLDEPAPERMPMELIEETWIEMCGDGERQFRTQRTLSAAASSSSTDVYLVEKIIEAGHPWHEVFDAVMVAFDENHIACQLTTDALPPRQSQ